MNNSRSWPTGLRLSGHTAELTANLVVVVLHANGSF